MADFRIKLVRGYWYYCGLTLPWYVSKAMVEDRLRKAGFTNFHWHERSESLPSNVNPKKSTHYDDSWELWLVGVYAGEDGIGTLPAKPAWIMMVKPNPGSEIPTAEVDDEPKKGSSIGAAVGIVAAVLTVGFLARRLF